MEAAPLGLAHAPLHRVKTPTTISNFRLLLWFSDNIWLGIRGSPEKDSFAHSCLALHIKVSLATTSEKSNW